MASINTMIEHIHGLAGTKDVNQWTSEFIESIYERYIDGGKTTKNLSDKQLRIIQNIYNEHFAG